MTHDIARWLEELGLGQYAQAFADNGIDREALPHLRDQDFERIGVLLGHMRRLQVAIETLSADEPPTRPVPPPSQEPEPQHAEAERRQLTVMFCDLVDSTAVSQRLDPEDLREVMRAYQDAVAGVVARYEGHVAKFLGDGILVYFGYPQAHEDDAQRAIRAGLGILEAVSGLDEKLKADHDVSASVRIGIHTGLVVAGELGATGTRNEIVGETPNVAARLQGLAKPNSIIIGPLTHDLLSGQFECEAVGPSEVRGISQPIETFRVVGESEAESRFEAKARRGLTPLVGREQEVNLLLDRWGHAKDGEGQVVLLEGEPGIGKSRIAQTMRDAIGDEAFSHLRFQCSPYYTNSAFYPFIDQFERIAKFPRDASPSEKLDRMEEMLRVGDDDLTIVGPLYSSMLSIETGERYPPLNMSPQRQKEQTIEAIGNQVAGIARHGPVVMVFEDAHWADPTTVEVLESVIGRIENSLVLVVITYRPEFDPPWKQPYITHHSLSRLPKRQCSDMVAKVTGGKRLPKEVLDQIVAKTDGVPLFVEELTKTVLEAGFLKDTGDAYALDGQLPPLAIPATLQDSLIARLDRLSPLKEVAQIGAVIGRQFSYKLLAAVADLSDKKLQGALVELGDAELIFRRGTPPDSTYTFKHALVQDTAYQSLLKARRRQLHARIAAVLEDLFSDIVANQPEVLARHFTDAGLADQAIVAWQKAGEQAIAQSASKEAIAHLEKGLELIAGMPDTTERKETELALQSALAVPLTFVKGWSAPDVARVYERARLLCDELGRTRELFPILRGLWNYQLDIGGHVQAVRLGKELIALADQEGDSLRRALSCRALGTSLFFVGRFVEAAEQLQTGIVIDDALSDLERRASITVHADSAGVGCRMYAGWNFWFSGFPDRAVSEAQSGLALSRELSFKHSIGWALCFSAVVHNHRRDFAATLPLTEAAIIDATEHDLAAWAAIGTMCRGRALSGLGESDEGIDLLRAGLANWHDIGARLGDTQWFGFLAAAYIDGHRFDDARTALNEAFAVRDATGEMFFKAELDRLRGVLLIESGQTADAERRLRQAIDGAREQAAKSLELRAATSFARLWGEQGKRQEAHDLLAPIYGWFTEGFDTADLKEAKALLDELG